MKLTGKQKTTVEPKAATVLRVAAQVLTVASLALTTVATRQHRLEHAPQKDV